MSDKDVRVPYGKSAQDTAVLLLAAVEEKGANVSDVRVDSLGGFLVPESIAKQAGLNEKDGLAFDNTDPDSIRRYAIRWVAKPEKAQDPRLLKFIAIYQNSPEVKATLKRLYGDLISFPW